MHETPAVILNINGTGREQSSCGRSQSNQPPSATDVIAATSFMRLLNRRGPTTIRASVSDEQFSADFWTGAFGS